MTRQLILPEDFADYAWEVEAKGAFFDAVVVEEGHRASVTFYDPVRLQHDVADELVDGIAFVAPRLLVVPRLTREAMASAVDAAPRDFFCHRS